MLHLFLLYFTNYYLSLKLSRMATHEDLNLFPSSEEPLDFSPQHQHTPDPQLRPSSIHAGYGRSNVQWARLESRRGGLDQGYLIFSDCCKDTCPARIPNYRPEPQRGGSETGPKPAARGANTKGGVSRTTTGIWGHLRSRPICSLLCPSTEKRGVHTIIHNCAGVPTP